MDPQNIDQENVRRGEARDQLYSLRAGKLQTSIDGLARKASELERAKREDQAAIDQENQRITLLRYCRAMTITMPRRLRADAEHAFPPAGMS